MSHPSLSPRQTGAKPHLLSYTYEGSLDANRRHGASFSPRSAITPRNRVPPPPPPQPRQQLSGQRTHSPSSFNTDTTTSAFSAPILSHYNTLHGKREMPYSSPIRSSTAAAAAAAAAVSATARAPLEPSPHPRPHLYGPAEGTPAQSPIPRTPPRYSTTSVAGHADLRCPPQSTERTHLTAAAAASATGRSSPAAWSENRYAPPPPPLPSSSFSESPQRGIYQMDRGHGSGDGLSSPVLRSSLSPSTSTCWLCEGRCLTGPGSTWAHAPHLFFKAAPHTTPVSTLTLCATCAAAVSADAQATSRDVLQRCQRTPALRYRTSAFVNAVREYTLLLTLMADKVVRACERMRRIHGGRASGTEFGLDASFAASEAPLHAFRLPLQVKVLRQLLGALEALLHRDGRATELAAAATAATTTPSRLPRQLDGPQQQVPCSEIMAPRERHVLLEEVAHVERQLMAAFADVKAEERERVGAPAGCASPHASRPSGASPLAERRTSEKGQAQMQRTRAAPASPNEFIVVSPRPSHAHGSPARRSDGDPLSALADPRRAHHLHVREATNREGAGEERVSGATPSAAQELAHRHVRSPGVRHHHHHHHHSSSSSGSSGSRERSPPTLTSPQRQPPRGTLSSTVGVSPAASRARTSVADPAPFPFAPAKHRERSDSPVHKCVSPHYATAVEGERDHVVAREAVRTQPADVSPQKQKQQRHSSAWTSPGRHTMEAMVGSAMWAAHRRVDDADGEAYPNTNASDEAHTAAMAAAAAADHADPENILLSYFAGRSNRMPAFRTPSPQGRSARRPGTTSRVATQDDGCLVDLANGSHPHTHKDVAMMIAVDGDEGSRHQLVQERHRRREAEEALLAAHTRIAALEQTTNDMAEELLTHRLSVTFRAHLAGMELLLRRWTLLGQNYCLQKSLLFAEEVVAVVRAGQREAHGLSSFERRRPPHVQMSSTVPNTRSSVASRASVEKAIEEDADEVWVAREEGHTDHYDGVHRGDVSGATSVAESNLSALAETPEWETGAAPYVFPSALRLQPLSLHL